MDVNSSIRRRNLFPSLFLVQLLMATTSLCAESQVFQNVAPSWGVSQYNSNGIYGAAVSTADWNNDGWPDLTVGSSDGALRTFVNLEGSGFSMTPLPWVMQGETKALIWLDLDNDGDDDLFVQEDSGRCGVLRNDGVEGFVDVTSSANLPQETTEAGGVSFGDMDNDGDLDLHLCRYLEMPFFSPTADRNVLLRNNGDLTFTNVTEESGIDVHIRLSFQSIWWDENGDGLQDIFVINDKSGANSMFQNQGDGTFIDVAPERNMDIVMDCMTASLGDFNQDNRQDLFLTNTPFGGDGLGAKLIEGTPEGDYNEVAADHGLAMDRFCWGALWMDVDNDMDLDLFVAEHEFLEPYGINYLYENLGSSEYFTFEPFGDDVYDIDYLNSHVVASADFDRNGWIDFVVHNVGNHAMRMWLNSGFSNGNQSIGIQLEGVFGNRPAVGSEIQLHAGGVVQTRIVHAGENYLSQENEVELFGLAQTEPEYVKVKWSSGLEEEFDANDHSLIPMANHLLIEGHSPCPQDSVEHLTCMDSVMLALPQSLPSEFSYDWTDQWGQQFDPSQPWTSDRGSIQMIASWQGQATCSVVHHVTIEAIQGDFDTDGTVGNSDILFFLSDMGCNSTCLADLDGNGHVGSIDLIILLALFGSLCL